MFQVSSVWHGSVCEMCLPAVQFAALWEYAGNKIIL